PCRRTRARTRCRRSSRSPGRAGTPAGRSFRDAGIPFRSRACGRAAPRPRYNMAAPSGTSGREGPMRKAWAVAACLAATASFAEAPSVLVDNPRVRVLRPSSAAAAAAHPSAVVVLLEDGPAGKAGDAWWASDAAAPKAAGAVVIVEPKAAPPAKPSPPAAT